MLLVRFCLNQVPEKTTLGTEASLQEEEEGLCLR
jgi:hypothetical protein